MPERIKRRTYKLTFLFFVGLFVFQGLFVFFQTASADSWASTPEGRTPVNTSVQSSQDPTAQTNGGSATGQASSTDEGCGWTGLLRSPISCAAKGILVGLRDMAGWLATGAASLFVWVVDPANITGPTGMLNKVSVYNLWKFIRDFFNLFFILILLFSAFATIFQIESFSIRKIFFNILLAALIINFSFPITRLLIDMTNVPMYYFLNIAVEGTSSGALKITESFLGASGITSVFMGDSQFPQLVMNVIFIFLFAISLLVLAVLMLIRVIALVLLVIFSPVGFAASLLPGTEKLGRDWWNYFWKYAFFGPSAALMLMVSVRFMNEIGKDGTFSSMIATGTGMSAGSFQSSAIAQITFLTIPIILIWTAIGMANSASIAGAGKVTGWGYGAARKVGGWTRKGAKWAVINNPAGRTVKGLGSGLKDRATDTKIAKWIKSPSYFESGAKGFAKGKGWAKGVEGEKDKYYQKQINEKITKNKEDKISRSAALKDLDSADEVTKVAGAASLAQMDNGIQTMEDLTKALNALNDPKTGKISERYKDRAAEIVNKADKKIIASTAATATDPAKSGLQNLTRVIEVLGKNNQKAISDLVDKLDDSAFEGSGADAKLLGDTVGGISPSLADALKKKIIKEGHAKVLVQSMTVPDPTTGRPIMSDSAAVNRILTDMKSVKDIVASVSLFQDAAYGVHAKAFMRAQVAGSPQREQEIRKTAAQESSVNPDIFFT